ncbi:MAG: flagellar hook-associated protein FlgK [Spirochaetia bacterium]|nr:flagellar hook-associated protein FlgK [Spirochaetia bacterium]
MPSTFMGLETAKRGLNAHQQALQVTGHNISNADNKNYARQRVNFSTMTPLYDPALNRALGPGMIGQGTVISSIERVRDGYIDDRIVETTQSKSYAEVQERYFNQMEGVYNEPGDSGIRASLDNFWNSWQDLSNYPEEYGHREVVKTRAEELVFKIRSTYEKLDSLKKQADFELQTTVNKINTFASEIRDINEKIVKSEALGDRPNDLLDRRDQLVQELSQMADISVSRSDSSGMSVYINGEVLVQGEFQNKLVTMPDTGNEGLSKIYWEKSQTEPIFSNGSIYSLLKMRDGIIKESIDKLDLLATNLHEVINSIHRDGFGLTGDTNIDFFKLESQSREVSGNIDLNNDGQNESTGVFKIAGKNALKKDQPIGINGVISFVQNNQSHTQVQIAYKENETLSDIIHRINKSGAGVVAYVDHRDRLVLKGNVADDDSQKNFIIRHIEDSGELLVGFAGILQNSGAAGAFDYQRTNEVGRLQAGRENITFSPVKHPAGALSLNEQIKQNVGLIAATGGKDVGGTGDINSPNGQKDGQNALKIAQALRHSDTMVGKFKNPEEFYNDLIAKLGVESRAAKDKVESSDIIMKNLENMRQSIMGVNMDEEMSNMVQFQHGYNASAKLIQTINEMLDYLINRLG